ncbi:MAG TPA: hypothetical protein VFJ15_02985 [Oleiagrimonas sp.]|nr:hypothetical protein [Oleiagrimonas sp.]
MPASINDYDEMIRGELARNCKVISYKQAGNTVRYHTRCTKPYHIDRTGTFTQLGNGNITGSEHAEGTNAGHHMSVHFTFAGVPTGRCEYKPSTK